MIDFNFLQLFLLLNIFIIGGLTTIAAQHAYAHFRPHAHEIEKPRHPAQSAHLPPAVKEKMLQAAEAHFQAVLDQSAAELQHDLAATKAQLNKQLSQLGAEITNDEMKRYKANLDQLQSQTEDALKGAKNEIITHQEDLKAKFAEQQAELEAKLTLELAAEKQRLVAQIDTKLADAVASFLTETLQHNVDLGAQSTYLTAMLEEHKAEFIKGVNDEA